MIQTKTIDGVLLRDMVLAGAALLEKNREAVDALNVFPVPDGDTGTNMSLTMQSAVREINAQEYLRADEAAAAISKGALKGARGKEIFRRDMLAGYGAKVKLYDGVKTWFQRINQYAESKGIEVEHYVISCGLKEIPSKSYS